MNNEILEVIKKNIPQQTADVLREYIEQSKKDKKALADTLDDVKKLQKANYKLEEEKKVLHGELDSFLKRESCLRAKEAELKDREARLYKDELEKQIYQLQCENTAKQQIIERDMDIMNTVFRNPKFVEKTSTTSCVPLVVKDQWNNNVEKVERHYQTNEVTIEKTIE